MFIEDNDWNDGTDAQTSQAVLNKTLKSSGKNKLKSKSVGKKSLLRTLQTLGTPQHLKSDDTHKESDSEAESAPPRPKKRKKKRNRGRKKTDESGKEPETPGVDKDKNAHNGPKRLNKRDIQLGSSKLKKPDLGKRESKVRPDTSTEKEDADKLSRKQWKVKMKNKRKCKNKYRQSESELDINKTDTAPQNETMEQLNVDFHSGNSNETVQTPSHNKAKKKDHKPPKRKRMETGDGVVNTPDIQRLKLNKRPIKDQVKENNHAKQNVPSSSHGSSRETGESLDAVKEDSPHPTPSKRQKIQMIKEMSRKRERLRKLLQAADGPEHPAEDEAEADVAKHPGEEEEEVERPPAVDRSASLRSRMEQRLEAARFRYINEVLYTTSSGEAKRMFTQDPQAFGIYHKGFTAQVQRWPTNPVDAIISYIQHKPPSKVVADFGCGDCKIARSVKNKVHCFDLAPICDLVTVCDMANVPLKDDSVHIAVFCLSLMGTNLVDFLVEANRVLVMGGVLKIAEVASRFDDVRAFLTTLTNLGFKMVTKDTENSHFYAFEFLKTKDVSENVKSSRLQLRPCVYKKR